MNRKQRAISLAAAFSVLIILSSCVILDRVKSVTVTAVPNNTSKFANIEGLECIPDLDVFEAATLIDVIDGDSIKVAIAGQEYQVRYIGIDTPEYDSNQRAAAIEATSENRRLLSGALIYLFKDQTNTDKYDRLLRYVVTNGKFVNLELVRSGHARSKWYRPDVNCQPLFDSAVPE